jgi:uncharacterized DUF497 family protein
MYVQSCNNIMKTIFEWDEAKAERNFRKHGVSFKSAVLVFEDDFAIMTLDRIVHGEQRWQTIGMSCDSDGCLLLLIAHTVQHEDVEIVRIISARRATRQERRLYGHS